VIPIPKQVGPCRFGRRGNWITVQCPAEFDALMSAAGGIRDSSSKHSWLLREARIGPVLRALRRATDPVFFRERPGR
jgi:hypothetical protein